MTDKQNQRGFTAQTQPAQLMPKLTQHRSLPVYTTTHANCITVHVSLLELIKSLKTQNPKPKKPLTQTPKPIKNQDIKTYNKTKNKNNKDTG